MKLDEERKKKKTMLEIGQSDRLRPDCRLSNGRSMLGLSTVRCPTVHS